VSEATLEISSDPLGADIELDGNFVGSTPSSVGVDAGEHTLSITKVGYGRWERHFRTSTGSVKVVAALSETSIQAVTERAIPISNGLLSDSDRLAENQTAKLGSSATASQQENGSTPSGGLPSFVYPCLRETLSDQHRTPPRNRPSVFGLPETRP
jgi:hypothetical protein